jgi:hypothetical protein
VSGSEAGRKAKATPENLEASLGVIRVLGEGGCCSEEVSLNKGGTKPSGLLQKY